RVLVLAFDCTVTVNVRVVPPLPTIVGPAVTLFPENVTVAPGTNPIPVIVTICVVPRRWELGLIDDRVGAGFTVKPAVSVDVPPSVLVTVTARAPVAALGATLTLTV